MDKQLRDLVETARSKTEAGLLQWESFSTEAFHAKIGAGTLFIHRFIPSDDNTVPTLFYGLQVSDNLGRIIVDEDIPEGSEGFVTVNQLFLAVRQSALKSDHIIREMLHALHSA